MRVARGSLYVVSRARSIMEHTAPILPQLYAVVNICYHVSGICYIGMVCLLYGMPCMLVNWLQPPMPPCSTLSLSLSLSLSRPMGMGGYYPYTI